MLSKRRIFDGKQYILQFSESAPKERAEAFRMANQKEMKIRLIKDATFDGVGGGTLYFIYARSKARDKQVKMVKHLATYCPHCGVILNEQTSMNDKGYVDSVYCININCKKGFEQHKQRIGDKFVR